MADEEGNPESSESLSLVIEQAYNLWKVDEDADVCLQVLTDDPLADGLTAHDWSYLVWRGEGAIEDDIREKGALSPEQEEWLAEAPELRKAALGLMAVIYSVEISLINEETARVEAEAERTYAEIGRRVVEQAKEADEIAAIQAETARLNEETARLNAEADRRERGGLFGGWTTRLWRRQQIAPGVRVNLSKSGPSLTLGPRGAHVTYGPKGKTETIGVPGTGAYLQRRTPKDKG